MGPVALPDDIYPELAPLPVPLAQHLYRYWTNKSSAENEQENLSTFLAAINEKRQYIYMYMDSFVRNEDDQSPHRLRYTTQWLRETLGPYTPNKQPIPSKTFDHWVANNFVRNTRKGQPTPDSGAALCIVRMTIEGTKIFPGSMPADTPPWECYAQDTPGGLRYSIPITRIEQISPTTLLWTPWPGAAWNPHWKLLSNPFSGEYFGAIRFASAETIHGQIYYNISKEELLSWAPELANQFKRGAFSLDELQANIHVALVHLAEGRVSAL